MTFVPQTETLAITQAVDFLRNSAGEWKSQRRYYTLKNQVEPQEVVSFLQIRFLEAGCQELQHLASLHALEAAIDFVAGAEVIWESNYTNQVRKVSQGSTIFGVKNNILYRDRGFATPKPVKAGYTMSNPQTMCLRTEYNNSVFEEELKLIGRNYRTRQTIISQAGEEQMIGQYLEIRL